MVRFRAGTLVLPSALAAVVLALPPSRLEAAAGREVFRAHAYRDVKVTTPTGSIQIGSDGISGSVDLDFSPAETLASRARPGAVDVKLGTPITYKVSTSLSVALPGDDKESYSLSLELQTGHGSVCKAAPVYGGGRGGTTATLSANVSCSDSVVYMFLFSYASPFVTKVSASYKGDKGHAGYTSATITTVYEFLEDEIYLYDAKPYSGTALSPLTKQTFTARARVSLQSRSRGDLALRLYDQRGVLQGSSDFVSVPRDETAQGVFYDLEIRDALVERNVSQLALRAAVIDPGQARTILKTDDVLYGIKNRCSLEGVVKREVEGKTYWVPGALVDLVQGDKPVGVAAVKTQPDPNDAGTESWFCIQLAPSFDYGKEYALRLRLQDHEDVRSGRLSVFPRLGDGEDDTLAIPPVAIVGKPFKLHKDARNVEDLLVSRDALGLKGTEGETVEAAAEVWWHLYRAMNRMTAYLPQGFSIIYPNFPIRLYLNRAGKTWACPRSCACRTTGCPISGSILLAGGPSMPGADPSTVWHELGHQIIGVLYVDAGGPNPADGVSEGSAHDGYYNDVTSMSLDEGFATFWALLCQRELDKDERGEFRWSEPVPSPKEVGFPVDANTLAWQDSRATADATCSRKNALEELAVAGLLLDLVDKTEDADTVAFQSGGSGHTAKDTVTWDARALTTLLKDKTPGTVLKLYQALIAAVPDDLRTPEKNPRTSGLSQLDELFVMHGIFRDKAAGSPPAGNWRYDLGEEVGRAAHDGPYLGCLDGRTAPLPARGTRESTQTIPGSSLDLKFLTETGEAVEGATLRLDARFGPGLELFDGTRELKLVAGKVYFPMPPPHYPVTYTLSVPGRSEAPVVFTDRDYAARGGEGESFLAATLVVPPPAPELTAIVPPRGAPGSLVTIAGKGFASPAGLNTVTFGEAPASVSGLSGDGLAVTVPASLAEGTYPVVVTTAAGASVPLEFTTRLPVASLEPASVDFATVYTGGSRESAVKLRNVGTAPLTVEAATAADPQFAIASPRPPFTVEPGAVREVKVAFRPTTPGAANATLRLTTNDSVSRVASLELSGVGDTQRLGPAAVPEPAAVNLGTVGVGQTRTYTVNVRSEGSENLAVASASSSHPTLTVTPSPALPASLSPYSSVGLALKLSPTAAGAIAATVTVATNDPRQPAVLIPVRAEAVASSTSACVFGVRPASVALPAAGGTADLFVTSPSDCTYSATASGFATIASGQSGTGGGTVKLSAPANPTASSRSATVTVSGMTVAVSQAGADPVASAFVPIVLSSAGAAGSFYTSELTLANRGTTDALVELRYTPAFGGGAGSAVDVVPAGGQRIFPDALAYLRSLGVPIPESGNRGGTVAARFTGVSSAASASATVRTTTAVALGRAGLAYPAVPRPLTQTAYLCGLRQDAADRSNVAVMNAGEPSDGDIVLRLTVLSGDPAQPQSRSFDVGLAPGGFSQTSQILASGGLTLTNGYVKVERVSGTAPFYAYGVINDQPTSDGSFVPPVVASSLAGKAGLTLPVAVETGSFSTEVVLTNFGATPKSARLTYVASAVQAAGNAATIDVFLAAGEQKVIPSFVEELRRRGVPGVGATGPTFAGAVFLSVPGGDVSGLALGARTSAPGGGGRFGLFYTGVPHGDAATSTAWLYGLQQNAENRTNVAIVNTGEVDGSPSSFRIELFDGAAGTLVKAIDGISIAARGFGQLSSILAEHAPGTSSAYARVTRTEGRNPFLCYAVVNDGGAPRQRSDDGAFVPMDLAEEAAPVPSVSVSPAAVDFGSVAVGQAADRTVDVTNTGGGTLHVSTLAVAGAGFRLLSPAAPFAVAGGVTQALSLRFEPVSAGAFAGTLTVSSDDGARPSVAVALSGTATAAASPRIEVSPTSLDFGKVAVGSSKDLPLVLKNGGGATLSVATLFVSHPAFTVLVSSLPASIAPGAQLTVPVRFAPVAAGALSLGLVVGSNDPATPQVVVALQGEGTAAATVTQELAIDDGTIESGFPANGYFVVNRLTPPRYPATLKSIRYVHAQYQGFPSPAGVSVRVIAFVDPSGSGTPPASPAFAVDQTVTLPAVPAGGAGFVDLVLVNGPVVTSGDLYVGLRSPSTPSGVAFPADLNGAQRRRGYYSTDGVTFRGPLVLEDQQTGAQTDVNVMIRAQVSLPAP